MTKRLLMRVMTAAALLAVVPLQAQTAQSAWKYYPYPADGFGVSAPIQPSYTSQTRPTDGGNVDIHTYTIPLGDNGVVMISSSEVRGLDKDSPKTRLQMAKSGALKAGNATLTTEKEITLGPYPGLQYEATSTQNLHVRARMYIVGNRLYQLLEVFPLESAFSADAERISTSFKVLLSH